MTAPRDAIAAVTHPDPYPYYADLVARAPLHRDATLGLWVASSAAAVSAILTSDLCRVRPPAEPVPRALLGSPAGDIFRHLVRMNDGPGHASLKPAVAGSLAALDQGRAAELARTWARELAGPVGHAALGFHLPSHVIGSLLGVPRSLLAETTRWTADFVRCLAPASTPEQVRQGAAAAGHLLDLFRSLLARRPTGAAEGPLAGDGLLASLARAMGPTRPGDTDVVVANGIGLLSQAYEATAGLIGSTLLALARHRAVGERVIADPTLARRAVQAALRYDSPVQNTRRFLARSGVVAGQAMHEGDAVLVVLAAANRDPAANPDPDRFDIFRRDSRVFTFGAGAHACPGEALATMIATAAVAEVLRAGVDVERLTAAMTYRPSANTRVPVFEPGRGPAQRVEESP
jgi:cytochrome P450